MAQAPRNGGKGRHDLDDPQAGDLGQAFGRGGHDRSDLVTDLRDAEADHDGGGHAREVMGAEPGFPALHLGQAERVAPVEAVAGVEVARRVPN